MSSREKAMESSAEKKRSKRIIHKDVLSQKLDGYLRSARGVITMSGSQAKKLAGFTAATGAAFVMAPAADADIVYSGTQNIPLTNPQSSGFSLNTSFDMDGGGNDFQMVLSGNYYFTSYQTGSSSSSSTTVVSSSRSVNARLIGQLGAGIDIAGGFARNFASGNIIGSAMTTTMSGMLASSTSSSSNGPFFNAAGFAGVKLASGNFGWIRINSDDLGNGGTFTVVDWAYEDSGGPIVAGATSSIPEPSSAGGLALLAMGFAGVSRHRRRKEVANERSDV